MYMEPSILLLIVWRTKYKIKDSESWWFSGTINRQTSRPEFITWQSDKVSSECYNCYKGSTDLLRQLSTLFITQMTRQSNYSNTNYKNKILTVLQRKYKFAKGYLVILVLGKCHSSMCVQCFANLSKTLKTYENVWVHVYLYEPNF